MAAGRVRPASPMRAVVLAVAGAAAGAVSPPLNGALVPAFDEAVPQEPLQLSLRPGSTCEVVTARAIVTDQSMLLPSLVPADCRITLYDKSSAQCTSDIPVDSRLRCVPMANVAHDWTYTWLYHVHAEYDNLADVLLFIPGSLSSRNRFNILRTFLQAESFGAEPDSFSCIKNYTAGSVPEWPTLSESRIPINQFFGAEMRAYPGEETSVGAVYYPGGGLGWQVPVEPAQHRPLGQWLYNHMMTSGQLHGIGDASSESRSAALDMLAQTLSCAHVCYLSTFGTTATNVHMHPRQLYAHVMAAFNASDATNPNPTRQEDAWFIEWSMEALFGTPARGSTATCATDYSLELAPGFTAAIAEGQQHMDH